MSYKYPTSVLSVDINYKKKTIVLERYDLVCFCIQFRF